VKNEFLMGKLNTSQYKKVVALISRKAWWHVPPRDPDAYKKRGKFLASSYGEAEFWGRPLNDAQKVSVVKPLVGDEATIERALFGRRVSYDSMGMDRRWRLDARMKKAALTKGYDSILLMSPQGFSRFRSTSKIPRSLELNVLTPTPTVTVSI
jgi:hypothetical protein